MTIKRVRKAVFPVAGLGTRFLPATKAMPKEMLPVVDTPAIQYIVEEAVRAGLTDVLMITGRNKRSLEDHFDRVPDSVSPLPSYDDAALDLVHVAWAGSTDRGLPHYYRVQGPGLLVEWDNTQRGANHAHSVWRDPDSDFGLDVLARHRTRHH